ncbi:MAG: TrkH family potassium uptake protein [Verrucomicrobiota bacterium]|nr:TrkH family potassium uptake protein [Verrucomicrobiota bacterium]
MKSTSNKNLNPARILVSGYLIVIAFGTLLLMLPLASTDGNSLGFIDSLFTSTSATCVTGLIVVNTEAAFTVFGQTVILFLIQIGGLGIMSMSTLVALLIGRRLSLKERMLVQQDLNNLKLVNVISMVKYVFCFTIVIEFTGALALYFRLSKDRSTEKAVYQAVFHSISAFNNAGFDVFGNSLESFTSDAVINSTIMILIILGSIGFAVLLEVYSFRKIRRFSIQTRFAVKMSLILLVLGFVLIYAMEWNNKATIGGLDLKGSIFSVAFLSVTPRTAGFNTVPTSALKDSTLFLLMLFMFIGASPGSTGGGIKTSTFGVLLLAVKQTLMGKKDIELEKRRLEENIVMKCLAITLLATGLVFFISICLTTSENMKFLPILFETVSAFGTVGLSTGITSELSSFGKVLITLTMFAGRVGPLTLVLSFSQLQTQPKIRYPVEKIMIG